LVAHFSGLPWEGKGDDFEFADVKPTAPFGQLPLLYVDGDEANPIAQCTAIAAAIGRMAGTDGGAGRDYARSVMLVAEAEDIYNAMVKDNASYMVALGERGKGGEDANRELWAATLPRHMGYLEKMLGESAAFTSTGETVGELYLFGMLHQLVLCRGPDAAGTHTPPQLRLTLSTFCGIRWVDSGCQRQKLLRLR